MELRRKENNPEEQRQNVDASRLRLHVLTKTELRPEWLQGQVWHPELGLSATTPNLSLFLGEIRFGFGELRAVSGRAADFSQLGIERLRSAGVPGGLRGTSGA